MAPLATSTSKSVLYSAAGLLLAEKRGIDRAEIAEALTSGWSRPSASELDVIEGVNGVVLVFAHNTVISVYRLQRAHLRVIR